MAEFWYADEKIAELEFDIWPEKGDIVVVDYDGQPREFIVDRTFRYYPGHGKPKLRYAIKASGGWDFH